MRLDDRLFRNAMGNFATGVTVITTEVNEAAHGMTANAFVSVSLNPKLVLVSIDKNARMLEFIRSAQKFAINILTSEQQIESMKFAGQTKEETPYHFDCFKDFPAIKDSLATMTCNVCQEVEAGDHILFIGEVTGLRTNEGDPLLFYKGKYHGLTKRQETNEK